MKSWIILLLFCASGESAVVKQAESNQKDLDVTSGLSVLIAQITASVQVSRHELTVQTETLIQNALNKIDTTVRNLEESINIYEQEVKDQIEKLVNEELLPCLDGVVEKIEIVLKETHEATAICRKLGNDKLSVIQLEVEDYRKVNQNAFDRAVSFVHACNALPNLGDKIKCAVDASRNISSTVDVFRENLKNFIVVVTEKVQKVVKETRDCINNEVALAQYLFPPKISPNVLPCAKTWG